MALANFLDKAALAASQVLQSFNRQQFEAILLAQRVRIAFNKDADIMTGRATLDLSVRLLARLYPHIQITCLTKDCEDLRIHLEQTAKSINPDIELSTEEGPTISIVVGNTPVSSESPVFYIGSDGWTARFSPDQPVSSVDTNNPFGAGAAACLGAANIFRYVFREQLPTSSIDQELSLSLLRYDRQPLKTEGGNINEVNLGETTFVGLGAIGNAAIWAISHLPQLQGVINLVDDQVVDLSNLQRYVLATQSDLKFKKVEVANSFLSQESLSVNPYPISWGVYLEKRNDWYLERVAVGLDSATDRIAVQTALPKRIINAWTQKDDMGVSRHFDFLNQSCLACLYIPNHEVKNKDQLVAEAVGLQDELMLVRTLLDSGEPVSEEVLSKIAKAKDIPLDELKPFLNRPLSDFYSEAVCGGMLLRMKGKAENEEIVDAPLAFQSALAGIMLAAEVVIDAGNLRTEMMPTITRMDLLRPLSKYLSDVETKNPSGNCICCDKDYREVYNDKWNCKLP